MRIDRRELGRYYASLDDEDLLALKRDDLTATAQVIYDLEVARRELKTPDGAGTKTEEVRASFGDPRELTEEDRQDLNWLSDGVCAGAFTVTHEAQAYENAAQAQNVLWSAGIPSHINVTRDLSDGEKSNADILNVMVPVGLALHAASILDRDFFNDQKESAWRDQLDIMSDKDLLALDPDIFCAGTLDLVARLKRVYLEVMEKRKLKAKEA